MSAIVDIMMLFFLAAFFAPIVAWFYAMCSICDHSVTEFDAVGQNKWMWLGLNLVLGPLASAGYIIWARPALKRARQTGINLGPIQRNPTPLQLYPYPVDEKIGGSYNKPSGSNEYFPEFDRDVA